MLAKNVDPHHIMWRLIWVCIVCLQPFYGFSGTCKMGGGKCLFPEEEFLLEYAPARELNRHTRISSK